MSNNPSDKMSDSETYSHVRLTYIHVALQTVVSANC